MQYTKDIHDTQLFLLDDEYRESIINDGIYKYNFDICGDYTDEQLKYFKGSHTITISECNFITDLTPFSDCKRVDIINCKLIEDVSPIKNVETVFLSDLESLKDVSCLDNITKLYIKNINNINLTQLSSFTNNLWISCKFNNEQDISILTSCSSLIVIACKNVIMSSDNLTMRPLLINLCKGIKEITYN